MLASRPRRIVLPRPSGPARRWQTQAATTGSRRVRVVEIRRETADAVTLVLEPEDGRAMSFRAGQYLTHCFEIDGVEERRAYSLSAAEGDAPACTVKLLRGGRASSHIATKLKPGASYRVLGPGGDFVLDPQHTGPLVMLAAGSGITPVISLIETALARNPQRRVRLVSVNRDVDHAIFRERLFRVQQAHASFDWTSLYTAREGRPDASRLGQLLRPEPDAQVYLCGPVALMDTAEAALRKSGFNAAHIRRERFVAAPRHRQRPAEPQEIVFRRSGRTVMQQPGESILDAGLRAGLRLDFSCTVGGCGHCKLRVAEGEVLLDEPNCLSPEERAAGYTLACSACATTAIAVEA